MNYRTQGKVKIGMTEYLSKVLEDMPQKHKGNTVTPNDNHLFEANKIA